MPGRVAGAVGVAALCLFGAAGAAGATGNPQIDAAIVKTTVPGWVDPNPGPTPSPQARSLYVATETWYSPDHQSVLFITILDSSSYPFPKTSDLAHVACGPSAVVLSAAPDPAVPDSVLMTCHAGGDPAATATSVVWRNGDYLTEVRVRPSSAVTPSQFEGVVTRQAAAIPATASNPPIPLILGSGAVAILLLILMALILRRRGQPSYATEAPPPAPPDASAVVVPMPPPSGSPVAVAPVAPPPASIPPPPAPVEPVLRSRPDEPASADETAGTVAEPPVHDEGLPPFGGGSTLPPPVPAAPGPPPRPVGAPAGDPSLVTVGERMGAEDELPPFPGRSVPPPVPAAPGPPPRPVAAAPAGDPSLVTVGERMGAEDELPPFSRQGAAEGRGNDPNRPQSGGLDLSTLPPFGSASGPASFNGLLADPGTQRSPSAGAGPTTIGWHPDPADDSVTRYWDGRAWIGARQWTGAGWVDLPG